MGPDHSTVAFVLTNLSLAYSKQHKYAEGETAAKRAIAIYEKISGPDGIAVALPLNNLATIYFDQNRFDEAEELFRRSIALSEKTFGANALSLPRKLHNLAAVYSERKQYAEAEQLHKRALAINEMTFGPLHAFVRDSLHELAKLYMQQGDWARAADIWRRGTEMAVRAELRGTGGVAQAQTDLLSISRSETYLASDSFFGLIKVLCRLAMEDPSKTPLLAAEVLSSRCNGSRHHKPQRPLHTRQHAALAAIRLWPPWCENARIWWRTGNSVMRSAI